MKGAIPVQGRSRTSLEAMESAILGSFETHTDVSAAKRCRALERHRGLQRKRADYVRWLQRARSSQEASSSSPKAGWPRSKPHRSARALMRTCLAQGSMEMYTDVPSVSMGHVGKSKRATRKPSVSPALSLRQSVCSGSACQRRRKGGAALEAWMDLLEETGDVDIETETVDAPDAAPQSLPPSFGENSQEASCAHSSVEAALQAMRSEADLCSGMLSLEKLAMESAQNAARIVDLEAVEFLIGRLQLPCNAAVQKAGCSVLACITRSGNQERARVAAAGGAQVFVSTMLAQSSSAEIQENCCSALKELAAQDAATRDQLTKSGAVQAVLGAMKLHAPCPRVQSTACGVLRNLTTAGGCCDAQCQEHLASLGAVQRVLHAMAMHGKDANVQCAGCWALFCLVVQNRSLQLDVAVKGGVHAVLAGMRAHVRAPKVQEAGCYAIRELANTVVSDVELWLDMVQSVSRALRENAAAAELQRAGQAARQRLAVRGKRITHSAHLVRPSITKRRRMAAPVLPVIAECAE